MLPAVKMIRVVLEHNHK